MIKQIVSASVGVAVWAVVAAEGVRPQAELLGSVEFASFSAFQQKVVDLGATINNPVVSMMAVPAVQNALTEQFGKLRQDAPMQFLCYADVAALRKALAEDADDAVGKALEPVFLYPCAEDTAAFLVNHPEAQKKEDGSIALEDGDVVLFAADGRTCAFAKDVASAKRALAGASVAPASAKRPLVRMDVTEAGIGILADIYQKAAADQALLLGEGGTNATDRIVSAFMKFQQSQMRRQNALLRMYARADVSIDLDETGFVVKGSGTVKPGSAFSPAAGFQLPAGALDAVPADAPLFFAANPLLQSDIQNEQEFRVLLGDVRGIFDSLFDFLRQNLPDCAQTVDGLSAATADLLTSAPFPAPTDWSACALAFGPQQEPFFAQVGQSAKASDGLAIATRFYAAVAEAVGKKWPGILRANGASLSVNWFRLVDVIGETESPTAKGREEAEKAKQVVAAIVGGPESEAFTATPSPNAYRTYMGVKGLAVPGSKLSGEARLAAALPEVAANRPASAFYLSLYSLVRDNVLPIAMKVLPEEDKAQVQPIVAVLPPAGANGAIAVATWSEKGGSCSFLMRITKDEIRSIGMAVNAVMAAQAQSAK